MSRVFIILLLALLPLQFAWGAAAGYCQHEQDANVGHFGHHAHKHAGKAAQGSGETTPDKKSASTGDDADCGICHFSCTQPLLAAGVDYSLDPSAHGLPGIVSNDHSPHVPALIERPKWTLAA